MKKTATRGPRLGRPDVREQIRVAARKRFLADGFHAVTMRSIAAEAGVDVALISYYFGSKLGVFGAAMSFSVNPADTVAASVIGDFEGLAARMLTGVLRIWDDPESGTQLRAIAAAGVNDPDFNRLVSEAISGAIIKKVAGRIGGAHATARAGVFAAQMSGVIFSRYLVPIEPFASMKPSEIVRRLGPSLQRTLEPEVVT
jgi:AcrR family transcriptional regulator